MKKTTILVTVLLVLVTCIALTACMSDELVLLYTYDETSQTKDATPLNYIKVSVIVTDSATDIEFAASDFSIIRNGVKESGLSFITGSSYENINGDITYTSSTAATFVVKNDTGAYLQIVFNNTDNVTELYHKTTKIDLK